MDTKIQVSPQSQEISWRNTYRERRRQHPIHFLSSFHQMEGGIQWCSCPLYDMWSPVLDLSSIENRRWTTSFTWSYGICDLMLGEHDSANCACNIWSLFTSLLLFLWSSRMLQRLPSRSCVAPTVEPQQMVVANVKEKPKRMHHFIILDLSDRQATEAIKAIALLILLLMFINISDLIWWIAMAKPDAQNHKHSLETYLDELFGITVLIGWTEWWIDHRLRWVFKVVDSSKEEKMHHCSSPRGSLFYLWHTCSCCSSSHSCCLHSMQCTGEPNMVKITESKSCTTLYS